MRKTTIIIALAISLMSIKCAEKGVNIVLKNKSNKNIVFSSIKNTDSINKIISEKSYFDPRYKYLKKNSMGIDTLTRADLYYYLSKEKAFYTFYFLRVIKFDTIKDNYVFEKRYDSINIDKEKILIGDEGSNTFIYSNNKIVFKSSEAD